MTARLTILLATLLAVAMPAAPAAAQSITHQTPAALTLSRCLQTSHRLSALLLVDESQSLRNTDAGNQRVAGLRAALTGLSRLASTSVGGKTPAVDVLLAGFAGEVKAGPWMSVTDSKLDALLDEAGAFAQRNDGHGTDYGDALAAARQLLAERAGRQTAGGGAAPCKVLIWFTDGKYTVPDVSDREVERRKHSLCRTGGLMDGIAEDGVVKFTVALSSEELRGREGTFLTSLTTGDEQCGTELSEDTGEFLEVDDNARLLFAFSSMFLPQSTPTPSAACPKVSCEIGKRQFTTVPGLSSFLIDVSTAADGVVIELQPPHGPPARLAPDGPTSLDVGGTPVTQRWVSGSAVEIQGDLAAGGDEAQGRWTFTLIDPQGRTDLKPEFTLHVFADVQPAIAREGALVVGEPADLVIALTDGAGRPLTGGTLVAATKLTATLTDPSTGATTPVVLTPDGSGRAIAKVTVPATSSAAFVFVDVDAAFSLPGVTNIVPQHRSFRFATKLPPDEGLPSLSRTELRMPSIEGEGSSSVGFSITGSRAAAGCVWFSLHELNGPEAAGKITPSYAPAATSQARCVRVAKGQRRAVTVTMTPEFEATGSVRGLLRAHLSSEIAKAERTTDLPVSFELVKPANEWTWVLFASLVLLGALLPVALLHGLNLYGARFTRGEHRLRALEQQITIVPHRSVTSRDGTTLKTGYLDAEPIEAGGGGRELEVGGVRCRAVASGSWNLRVFSLFTGPFGLATAIDGGEVLAGGAQPLRRWHGGATHEVPLALPGTWLFTPTAIEVPGRPDNAAPDRPPPPPTRVEGVLSLVMSADRGARQGEELLASATAVLRTHEWSPRVEPPAPAERRDEADRDPGEDRRRRRSPLPLRLPWRKRADEREQWPVQSSGDHDAPPDPGNRWPTT